MVFIVVGCGLLTYIGWRFWRTQYGIDKALLAILTFTSGICGLLLGAMAAMFVGGFFPTERQVVHTYELAAMQSNSGMEGSFFLIGGSFGTSWTYRYYQKEGGYLRPKELSINQMDVLVKEVDDSAPRLDVYESRYITNWHAWIGSLSINTSYVFVVPKGSVVQDFNL